MSIQLKKVTREKYAAKKGSSGRKSAVRVTCTGKGYRVGVASELIAEIGITSADFKKSDVGVFVAEDGNGNPVLFKDNTANSAKVSGTVNEPVVYDTEFALAILDIAKQSLETNKTFSFSSYTINTDKDTGKAVAVLKC